MSIIQLLPEIEERSSITNWSSKSISEETWEILFEAARRAPSSWNRQPARYVVVSEENVKKSVCNALHRTNKWAEKAAGLIQVADPEDDDRLDKRLLSLRLRTFDDEFNLPSAIHGDNHTTNDRF
jgi:nitroreductase